MTCLLREQPAGRHEVQRRLARRLNQGAELRTGMRANIDSLGEKRVKVLTVPVEAIFKKGETEVVYVRKPDQPKAAEKRGFLSSVFAAGKTDAPPAKLDPKDAWKEKFELKEIETGLAAVNRRLPARIWPACFLLVGFLLPIYRES